MFFFLKSKLLFAALWFEEVRSFLNSAALNWLT